MMISYIYIHIYIFIYTYIHTYEYTCRHMNAYIYIYTPAWIIAILIIPDTCLIQHVYASACACMFTLSTASTDALSSTSMRTLSACPVELAHSNTVLPITCELAGDYSLEVNWIRWERARIHVQLSIHAYIHICVHIHLKKKSLWIRMNMYVCIYMKLYVAISIYIFK
jgi:hypothetical protein